MLHHIPVEKQVWVIMKTTETCVSPRRKHQVHNVQARRDRRDCLDKINEYTSRREFLDKINKYNSCPDASEDENENNGSVRLTETQAPSAQ